MNVVKIFNYRINISIAKPKTIWFTNIRKPNKGINQRVDSLISLQRTYHRDTRTYTYSFIIGRVHIIWAVF